MSIEPCYVLDHAEPEFVQFEELLRQVVLRCQRREPRHDAVDLSDADTSDLVQGQLTRLELPLRVQSQPDIREPEQRLIPLSLGQKVGAARLQIEGYVHAGLARGADPGSKRAHARF